MDYAFDYIHQNGGIDSEEDYPYTAHRSTCNTAKAARHVVAVASHADVAEGSASQMQTAVSAGPVSIAIEADQYGFQHYNGGVFSGTCGTNLDHGVLIVGLLQITGKSRTVGVKCGVNKVTSEWDVPKTPTKDSAVSCNPEVTQWLM